MPAPRFLGEILREGCIRQKIRAGFMVNIGQDLFSLRVHIRDPTEINVELLFFEPGTEAMPGFIEFVGQQPGDSAFQLQGQGIRSILNGDP